MKAFAQVLEYECQHHFGQTQFEIRSHIEPRAYDMLAEMLADKNGNVNFEDFITLFAQFENAFKVYSYVMEHFVTIIEKRHIRGGVHELLESFGIKINTRGRQTIRKLEFNNALNKMGMFL